MKSKIVSCFVLFGLCLYSISFAQPPPPPFSMKPASTVETTQKAEQEKININTATAKELEKLPGIGKVLSKRIIEYRQKYGSFNDVKDITKVRGIGRKRYELIKDLIRI